MRPLFSVLLALAAAGCGSSFEPTPMVILQVAPTLVECTGVGPQLCMQVRQRSDGPWLYFYDGIRGFTYEPGYLYLITVSIHGVKNPPADGSSLEYRLVRLISKTAAPSE
jgi:hypothetical protein